MNKLFIVGNLTRDPEMRSTSTETLSVLSRLLSTADALLTLKRASLKRISSAYQPGGSLAKTATAIWPRAARLPSWVLSG